jgi:hypothetical protein
MAVVQIKASDLTGDKGEAEEFGRLVVRRHPALERAVELDVKPAEVAGVKTVGDVVHLGYYEPGSTQRVARQAPGLRRHVQDG